MSRAGIVLVGGLVLFAGWYIVWHSMLAGDVKRIEATIAYQDQQFRSTNKFMALKAEKVVASGFPFHFRVKVVKPELSMVYGNETFAITLPELLLMPQDEDQGRYLVFAPSSLQALYAEEGKAPEQYAVSLDAVPDIALRAQGTSTQCPNFPGMKGCAAVAADAPLTDFAVSMPSELTLHVTLNGESKDIGFHFTSMNVPIFYAIPTDASNPLEVFVGMLREALVFQGK